MLYRFKAFLIVSFSWLLLITCIFLWSHSGSSTTSSYHSSESALSLDRLNLGSNGTSSVIDDALNQLGGQQGINDTTIDDSENQLFELLTTSNDTIDGPWNLTLAQQPTNKTLDGSQMQLLGLQNGTNGTEDDSTLAPTTNSNNVIEEVQDQLIAVQTGFYYNTSIFYPDNTAVLIFYADFNLNSKNWTCVTDNESTKMFSVAKVRSVAIKSHICKWTTYILTCQTVVDSTQLTLTLAENQPSNITVALELPSRKPRGIVSCYAPMYFEQRWQAIAMIHELNAGFGVDLQVHYVQSVVGQLMELLEPMVKLGLLELRGLDIPDYGKDLTEKLGYNPAQGTEARNQVMALQDCYFRYRESAEFIMVSDPDDLFIPIHGKNLYDEFSYWKKLNPMASAFYYMRNVSSISTSLKLKKFNVWKTLKTLQITKNQVVGKSIYNPKYAETPWIHWPGLNITPTFEVPPGKSYALHLKYSYDKPPATPKSTTNIKKVVNISKFKHHSFIDYKKALTNITDLADPSLEYAQWITACRLRLHVLYQVPVLVTHERVCTTITSCNIPRRNVTCNIAVRQYRTECTLGNEICAILPEKVLPDFVQRSDGCAWGISSVV